MWNKLSLYLDVDPVSKISHYVCTDTPDINNLKLETPLIRDTQPEYKAFLIKKKCNKLHYQSLHV